MATDKTIIVKAKTERGFYRAGLHFTREGREINVSDLTKAQLEAIRSEPNLVVSEPAETDEQRKARAKAEAKAAEQANTDALAREKVATKDKDAKVAWETAAKAAQVADQLDDAAWKALPASDRVARIEAALAGSEGAKQ